MSHNPLFEAWETIHKEKPPRDLRPNAAARSLTSEDGFTRKGLGSRLYKKCLREIIGHDSSNGYEYSEDIVFYCAGLMLRLRRRKKKKKKKEVA